MSNPAKYLLLKEQKDTVNSLTDVYGNGDFYTIDYQADYRLDDVLKVGARNGQELMAVLQKLLITDRLPVPGTGAGCSIFTAKNKKGHVLVGRNLDFRHKPHNPSVLFMRTQPKNDYRSLSMGDLGFMPLPKGAFSDGKTDISAAVMLPYLVLDGMNEKGLFIGVMQLRFPATKQDTGKPKTTTTLMIRTVLDKAATVEEAVSLFKQYDMYSPMDERDYHFLLVDKSGRTAVIEYTDNVMHVLDDTCCTNFYLYPEMEQKGGGKLRYEIMKKVLEFRDNTLEKRDMMDILRLISQPAGTKGKSDTLWSAVYDLTDLTMDVAVLHRYTRLKHFSL